MIRKEKVPDVVPYQREVIMIQSFKIHIPKNALVKLWLLLLLSRSINFMFFTMKIHPHNLSLV